ncbi:argininosuccinate lyase [Desulfobotulus mexicanus]|uniref:Argininosuccinate lyase n=1 Tax=Desulfobotulus mexicanus TaxID=2586642 RepID=A0A5S5MDB1_9BACT|nr:argininosuccinate lyase [Desulfobotulus mexicanus]TYT73680.1 argininosuccinate lyase [Desulfobotulus mexicanus]
MAEKLWDGRFDIPTDKSVERFTSSIATDSRMFREDIEGSIAHSRMLVSAGILSSDEADAIEKGLREIEKDIAEGRFVHDDSLEDIHMHIESALTGKIGDTARKLHTARSRNDQVALDVRLWLRRETEEIITGLHTLRRAFVDLAEAHMGVPMPGYTHLQRAQPVLFSHHMMAYYEMFTRDAERLKDALKRINVLPLGAAALAGTPHPIDREMTRSLLNFPAVSANSMDTVADRDFVAEFLACASICMMHFSRISEELILWSSSEFAFIQLSDAFTTGSSIMPQKKNPDIPELVRGKTGRVYGHLMNILTLMKSLPMAYNRDMQEDKFPLFDGVDTLKSVVDIYIRMLPNMKVLADRMRSSCEKGFLNATDMADYLVEKGLPFRKCHSVVGKAVAYALSLGKELQDLSLEELKGFSELVEEDLFEALSVESMINRRKSAGGTATENVQKAVNIAREVLAQERV